MKTKHLLCRLCRNEQPRLELLCKEVFQAVQPFCELKEQFERIKELKVLKSFREMLFDDSDGLYADRSAELEALRNAWQPIGSIVERFGDIDVRKPLAQQLRAKTEVRTFQVGVTDGSIRFGEIHSNDVPQAIE